MTVLRMGFFTLTALLACQPWLHAQPPAGQATLQKYVADLQQNPSDTALREKVIRLAAETSPAPDIPETAREHFVMAVTFAEEAAKGGGSYSRAIAEYQSALSAAPWWGEAYRKLAIACKLAGRYDEAIRNLTLYLASRPADARDAQDEIYKLKALKETAAGASAPPAPAAVPAPPPVAAAPPPDPFAALLRRIDGRRYTLPGKDVLNLIDVKGRVLVCGWIGDANYSGSRGYHEFERIQIAGRETTVPRTSHLEGAKVYPVASTFVIGEDGERIVVRMRYNDGDTRQFVYLRQY